MTSPTSRRTAVRALLRLSPADPARPGNAETGKGLVRVGRMPRIGRRWRWIAALLPLGGCVGVGAATLPRDRIDYAATLSEAGKRQTLLNIVRLRYGDTPAFLGVSEIIAAYTAQGTVQAGLNAYPSAISGNFITAVGTLQYTDHPTFTFAPIDGEKYAHAYLRPLSPTEILSLARSGVPIDILLRVAVQSLNGLQGGAMLDQAPSRSAASYYRVIQDLRRLQETGGLTILVDHDKAGSRVALVLSPEARHEALVRRVQRSLHLDPRHHAYVVVEAADTARRDVIAAATRPMLGILGQIGAQASVPAEDVARGRTRASVVDFPEAGRSAILILSGDSAPASSYAAVRYGRRWYWVAEDDYQSKVAFTVVQVLEAVAQTNPGAPAPVVTIPAS